MSLSDDLDSVKFEDVGSSGGASPSLPCVITFQNNSTAADPATITFVGARFWFQDVEGVVCDDQIVKQTVAVGPGGATVQLTSRPECVQKVYYGYEFSYKGKTFKVENAKQTPAPICLISFTEGLNPA
jgi:hypothetical protein